MRNDSTKIEERVTRTMAKSSRDYKIDWIRALCSLTIILAHVNAPNLINQIRAFDVIALVLISGMSFGLTEEKEYRTYIVARTKKLLLPTYLMITTIFVMSYVAAAILNIEKLYTNEQMIRSFFLLSDGSMGYVWIVRVYFTIALIMPLCRNLIKRIETIKCFILALGTLLILGVGLYYLGASFQTPLVYTLYSDYIYNTFVYGCVSFAGLWFVSNKDKWRGFLFVSTVCFLVCQIVVIINGNGFSPNAYKYPPRLYYCSYGVLVALVLYAMIRNGKNKIVIWLSRNSFSLYLWHILVLRVFGLVTKIKVLNRFETMWGIEYVFVLVGAVLLTFLWGTILRIVRRKRS